LFGDDVFSSNSSTRLSYFKAKASNRLSKNILIMKKVLLNSLEREEKRGLKNTPQTIIIISSDKFSLCEMKVLFGVLSNVKGN
jgi:hypothetical protein